MSFILKNLKEFNLNNFIKNNQIKTKKKKGPTLEDFFIIRTQFTIMRR